MLVGTMLDIQLMIDLFVQEKNKPLPLVTISHRITAAKHEAKRCIQNALGGREEHANALRTYLVAIDNMECGKEHAVFAGKCPIPDSRGGHHIGMTAAEDADKMEEEDEIDDSQIKNASMLAMRYYTLGMPSGTFSTINMRNICKQTGERNIRFGFCDPNTEDECFAHAYSINVMGKLAQFIGAQLRVVNNALGRPDIHKK